LFAHTVAKIEPEWVVAAAEHLIKRQHYEPHYDSRSGQVMAYEKITLYGLTIVEKKSVVYGHIDSAQAREVFIRAALVEGQYGVHPKRKNVDQRPHPNPPLTRGGDLSLPLARGRLGGGHAVDFFTHQEN